MTLPVGEIARSIESRDAAALKKLSGIGSRTAQKIIATLEGKLDRFMPDVQPTRVVVLPPRRAGNLGKRHTIEVDRSGAGTGVDTDPQRAHRNREGAFAPAEEARGGEDLSLDDIVLTFLAARAAAKQA